MYLTITISDVTCYRSKGISDAEIAIRSERLTGNFVIAEKQTPNKAAELSKEQANQLYNELTEYAANFIRKAGFKRAKE